MAITLDELIERAKQLAGAAASPDLWARAELNLAACVPIAVHECTEECIGDPLLNSYLQQDYSVTLNGSGVGSLLTATGSVTSAADMLLDSIVEGRVKDADGNVLVYYPHKDSFYGPLSTLYGYYCLAGRSILTRAVGVQCNTEAEVQAPASPLTVTATFAPASLTYWPDQLADELAKKLVTVAMRKVEGETK